LLTAPLDEQHIQRPDLQKLFVMYDEVRLYLDDEEDGAAK
jgi:hypothetical protein